MNKKCIGCGTILQDKDINKEGYITNINNNICERCFRLKHYGEYKEVTLNNKDYQKILDEIPKNSLVLYLTSVLNINLDNIDKFSNKIIILTKKDLLPKSIKDTKLINYIKTHVSNYKDIEVISTIKNYNLDNLINKIKKYNTNNKIYIVGNTNSGKSTLLNKIINNYTDQISNITTSIYPSTTLNTIEININNIKIIDTPGLISNNSILNYLTPKEIKQIIPKKEIKPRTYQIKKDTSLIINNIIRIDFYEDINITIYISNTIKITKTNLNNNTLKNTYKKELSINQNQDILLEDFFFIKLIKETKLTIYTKYNINIIKRDNLI